ncbi:MAG: cupin domain-containing protein [Rhodothermus sp.]|nr:cupin domain-containing protein [Rhodothermus sp.]
MEPFILKATEWVQCNRHRLRPVLLTQNERLKVQLVCFEPGQQLPVHTPDVDLVLTVLEGHGVVIAGEKEGVVGPGSVVFVPANVARSIRAHTRLVALAVVAPPTVADSEEIAAALAGESD